MVGRRDYGAARSSAAVQRDRQGQFAGANGHAARGRVFVEASPKGVVMILGDDFYCDGAGDPRLSLGSAASLDRSAEVARLKRNSGTQRYQTPGLDPTKFTHVYLWCAETNQPLGRAALR